MKIELLTPRESSWNNLKRRTYFYHYWIINHMFLVDTDSLGMVQLRLLYL